MARFGGNLPLAELNTAVESLQRDLADLRQRNEELRARVARLQAERTGPPRIPTPWRDLVLEHYVSRVRDLPGVAAVAAWPERDGLVVVTVMDGYDREAEDRIIECELTAYREHLSHMPIDFQIRAPGSQLESELLSLADAVLWRRQ